MKNEVTLMNGRDLPPFEQVVSDYYEGLYRFAYSLSRNPEEASDLTQDVFVIYARKGQNLRDPSKLKSWLFTSLYREFLRKRKRAQRFTLVDNEILENQSSNATGVGTQTDARLVLDALDQLEETFRVPLILYYLEDFSYQEIAESLDVPIGTIMSRLSRGKQQLKTILSQTAISSNTSN